MTKRKQPETKSNTSKAREPKPDPAATAAEQASAENAKPKSEGDAIAELGDQVGGPA